jgi:hypothetical protein
MLVEKPTGTIRTAYDHNNEPYLFEATGAEAKRFVDIWKADEEGRLLVLPCKVGDELWIKRNGEIQCETVDKITVDQTDEDDDLFISIYTMSVSVLSEDIGRLVFLTREDAEKALKQEVNE